MSERLDTTEWESTWLLIDEALLRLRESPGDFDVSVISGLTIPFERLELVPWTRVLAGEAEPTRSPGGGGIRDVQEDRSGRGRNPRRESRRQ